MISETNSLNYTALIMKFILSFIGVILFLCFSVSLAGHKDGELKLALADKIPCDLHLALSVFADFWVGAAAVGLAYLRHEQILWDYEADFFVEEIVAHPELFMIVLSTVVAVFVLILSELRLRVKSVMLHKATKRRLRMWRRRFLLQKKQVLMRLLFLSALLTVIIRRNPSLILSVVRLLQMRYLKCRWFSMEVPALLYLMCAVRLSQELQK
jgi:hypothetical protein